MKWRSEFVRCIGKRDEEFVVVLDVGTILATGLKEPSGDEPRTDSAAA